VQSTIDSLCATLSRASAMAQRSILSFFKKPEDPKLENASSHPDGARSSNSNGGSSRGSSLRGESSRGGPYRGGSSRGHSSRGGPYRGRLSRGGHPRGSISRGGSSTEQHQGPDRRQNMDLKKIADETKTVLPNVLNQLPTFDATDSSTHHFSDIDALDARCCPGFELVTGQGRKGARIKVLDMDTYDAAICLAPKYRASTHTSLYQPYSTDIYLHSAEYDTDDERHDNVRKYYDEVRDHKSQHSAAGISTWAKRPTNHPDNAAIFTPKPVAVLNLASERSAGGGWYKGALAQEEALCYRSSLYLSLHKSYYPLPSLTAIYSPSVIIIRDAMARGHALLGSTKVADLPVVSVISVAALRNPELTDDQKQFKNEGQRAETKRKIRLTLRVAAGNGHSKLVLGALGCGVFANPPKEVAECFLEVFREKEFQGGWWEEIAFAIMDNVRGDRGGKDGVGNYGEFYRVLNGQIV
jgi:uncharacterized protein (TIGR02452 family)